MVRPRKEFDMDWFAAMPEWLVWCAAGAAEVSSRRMAERGGNDVRRGLVDTDKGPAMQETYEKVRKGTPDPDKKARR